MRVKLILSIAILLLTGCTHLAAKSDAVSDVNKQVVVNFYTKAFVEHKPREAAELYISESTYIQHNPHVKSGRAAFIDFFEPYLASHPGQPPSKIKRVIADGNLVALHVESPRAAGGRPYAIVDIFRVEDGKIVEHWDVMQETPEQTASGQSMF